jgi:hypothetical protein
MDIFHSDLEKTNTPEARAVYEAATEACLGVKPTFRFATEDEDKAGIDFFVTYGNGHEVKKSVQTKVCWGPLDYGFYPYETTNGRGGPGWVFSHDPADFILWIRATDGFERWNARLYLMPPIIEYLKTNREDILRHTKKNRFGSAGVYKLWNEDTDTWLVGCCNTEN